ncbi:unnamed protein product [Cylicocyclus nassatus]|uniref:Galactosylgalactosylxylosylprotein 3-beta-glucuronosyltransferase n=1 Tax=Cylicocyclus nassatus TaxID=53992 RepID=A0AA36H9D8_CYLNA|nr:unnamed protein product [Cylicocyclus nassatus]
MERKGGNAIARAKSTLDRDRGRDRNSSGRRGWTHRNLALRYIRENYGRKRNAVLYFADDDNSYDVRLFNNYIRNVSRIGVWAVGLVGGAWVEAPHVSNEGKVIAWDVMFAPGRPFATDMAGFAIHIKEIFRARHAAFNTNCAKNYKQGPESCFLTQFGFNKEHLEPFGYKDFPKEMLRFVALLTILALVCAQWQQPVQTRENSLDCGYTCTRKAQFRVSIDGVMTTATCTANGADPKDRCAGCCQARALAAGLTAVDGAGFPSTNGRECICCFYNACRL